MAAEIKAFGCNASGAVGARGGAAAAPNDARNAAAALTAGGTAIYVDYAAGSDSADGSVAHPLKTVVAATLPTDNSASRRVTKVKFGIARSPELWVLAEHADIRAQI